MINFMNIEKAGISPLELVFAQKLREILSEVSWVASAEYRTVASAATQVDFEVLLQTKHGPQMQLVVQCKAELKPSTLSAAISQLEKLRIGIGHEMLPVLASRHVSPRVAELCAERGVSWFDLAGNCRIVAPGIYIERTGHSPAAKPLRPGADLGSWASARVLRVLLAPEWAGRRWTQRDIELETSNPMQPEWPTTPASLGLVNKVVRYLKEEAFVEQLPERGFRVVDPLRLLSAWRTAYRYQEHQRERCFTLLRGQRLAEALARLQNSAAPAAVYASFSAADIQAPCVHHMRTWLYVRPTRVADVLTVLEAKPVDSGENIVLLLPADDGVFYRLDSNVARLNCTNPVQTYLDPRHGGGRGEEAAEAILEQRLMPAWKEAGLL